MVGRNPPWSDLPQELLSDIANTLTSDPISIPIFRSVCRSWRSSVCPPFPNSSILSPPLPLSIPLQPNSYYFDSSRSSNSFLSVTIIYALHRPQQISSGIEFSRLLPDTWILFVDEFAPGKLSIRKPFLSSSYSTPINFPNINLIDFNVRELGRFHNLSYSFNAGYYGKHCRSYKLSKPRFCLTGGVNKVVVFPNAPAAVTLRDDGTLGMYRLNVGINEEISKCETKHDGKGFRFDDIVEYKGRVLGIDRRGRVYQINYHSSVMTPFVLPIVGGGGRRKRLVESLGLLHLVVRCKEELGNTEKRPKFKVYELNEGRKKWCEIASLGDRCFSFGPNFSFSASAQEFGTYMKNCILFVKNSFRTYSGYDDDYKEFSKLKNSQLDIGVWHLGDTADTDHGIESYPDNSDSLWPPPSWIWNVDRMKRIEIVETAVQELLSRVAENLKVMQNEIDRFEDSSDTNGQMRFIQAGKVALEAGTDVSNLKTRVDKYYEEETEFLHDLREFREILNKVEESGSSHETTKERPGLPDNFKTSPTCQDRLRSTMSKLRTRYASLFSIEEQVTHVENLKSLIGPIPT